MAVALTKRLDNHDQNDYREFTCDDASDVPNLPTDCATGSKAFVIDTSETYMLNSVKEWKKIYSGGNSAGGGSSGDSGGGTVTDEDVAADDEVQDIINGVFGS